MKDILGKVTVGVVTAVLVALLALFGNFASNGGLIRVLGGVTPQDVEEVIKKTTIYRQLDTRISSIERKTNIMSLDEHRFSIQMGSAHYDFPSDGNFNIGLNNGVFCFSANDKSRPPNPRCF